MVITLLDLTSLFFLLHYIYLFSFQNVSDTPNSNITNLNKNWYKKNAFSNL